MDDNKKEALNSLEEHKGIVSSACASIGLARSTFYKWAEDDPEFKSAIDDIRETAIDFVESKLMEKINGIKVVGQNGIYDQPPSDTAIIFFLKTRGKKRGYVERQEVEQSGGLVLHFDQTDYQLGADVSENTDTEERS